MHLVAAARSKAAPFFRFLEAHTFSCSGRLGDAFAAGSARAVLPNGCGLFQDFPAQMARRPAFVPAMYETFFGLKEKPFNLTPDPDFLYLNSRTREAFDEILYGIERREGFAVIVGDVGTGKTTLSCALIEKIEGHESIRTVLIQNPMLSELDILRSILQDLGVSPEDPGLQKLGPAWTRDLSKKELIDCLNVFLAERAREDAFTVLIIDEAQNLSVEMLEQLRLLSNLETTKKKLLQIIFLGQLELERKLAKLRQLNQRISVRFSTRPFSRDDTEK